MRPARAVAAAKINLALVVGEPRADGLHDVASILQRVDVCDRIELEPARELAVEGFERRHDRQAGARRARARG